jgi:hypothetical protein
MRAVTVKRCYQNEIVLLRISNAETHLTDAETHLTRNLTCLIPSQDSH